MFFICAIHALSLWIRLLLFTVTHKAAMKTVERCACISVARAPKGRIAGSWGMHTFDFFGTRDTTCQSGCLSLPPSRYISSFVR